MALVRIYAHGMLSMSVCAPKALSQEEVELDVNQQTLCGTARGWRIAKDPTFKTGETNPCACHDDAERLHYLLDC